MSNLMFPDLIYRSSNPRSRRTRKTEHCWHYGTDTCQHCYIATGHWIPTLPPGKRPSCSRSVNWERLALELEEASKKRAYPLPKKRVYLTGWRIAGTDGHRCVMVADPDARYSGRVTFFDTRDAYPIFLTRDELKQGFLGLRMALAVDDGLGACVLSLFKEELWISAASGFGDRGDWFVGGGLPSCHVEPEPLALSARYLLGVWHSPESGLTLYISPSGWVCLEAGESWRYYVMGLNSLPEGFEKPFRLLEAP